MAPTRKYTKSTNSPTTSHGLPLDPKNLPTEHHKTASRLANLLKHRKARQWINHEWFYGHIDKPFFQNSNDFENGLQRSFSQLKSRQLTRTEWSRVRRMLGKRRRCSPSFFRDGRKDLERYRQMMRVLQSARPAELSELAKSGFQFPRNVPGQLLDGCNVDALVRDLERMSIDRTELQTGVVQSLDVVSNCYMVKMEQLGICAIPDSELSPREVPGIASFLNVPMPEYQNEMIGNHPLELLKIICCLRKILTEKRQKLNLVTKTHDEIQVLARVY